MKDLFTIYSAILLMAFSAANHKGYVLDSLFNPSHHVGANQNHYHK